MSHSPIDTTIEGLKEKIAAGDQAAFRQLFNAYCTRLVQFSLSIVKSKEAAREIVDEVFIKIWRNRTTATGIQNLKVYLYTATKNTSLNYLAANARRNLTEGFDFFSAEIADTESPEQKMISTEMLQSVREAIEQLPPRCRMVFKLVREDGLSYREVAQVLNISSKTVDAQMVIAVRHISEKLAPSMEAIRLRQSKKKSAND